MDGSRGRWRGPGTVPGAGVVRPSEGGPGGEKARASSAAAGYAGAKIAYGRIPDLEDFR